MLWLAFFITQSIIRSRVLVCRTSEAIYVLTMPLNADRLHKAEDQQESFQRMIWWD